MAPRGSWRQFENKDVYNKIHGKICMFCSQCLFKTTTKNFTVFNLCAHSNLVTQVHTKFLSAQVSFPHLWMGSWYFPCPECLGCHSGIPANLKSTFLNPRPTSYGVPRTLQLSAISFLQIAIVFLFLNSPCTISNFHVFRYTFDFSHQITGHLKEKSNLLSLFTLGI